MIALGQKEPPKANLGAGSFVALRKHANVWLARIAASVVGDIHNRYLRAVISGSYKIHQANRV